MGHLAGQENGIFQPTHGDLFFRGFEILASADDQKTDSRIDLPEFQKGNEQLVETVLWPERNRGG